MKQLALSINGTPIIPPHGVPGGANGPTLNSVISVAFDVLILFAVIATLIYIVWGGFDWITSEGDKQKVAQARTKLTFAIIGLIIIFLSFFIVQTFTNFFLGTGGGGAGGGF